MECIRWRERPIPALGYCIDVVDTPTFGLVECINKRVQLAWMISILQRCLHSHEMSLLG